MRFQPQISRRGDRLDAALAPPSELIAVPMKLMMMSPTERDRELVADLAAQRRILREAQMMGVTRSSPADEANMLRHIFEVVAITQPARLGQGKSTFINALLAFPGAAPRLYRHAGASIGNGPRRLGSGEAKGCGSPPGRAGWSGSDATTVASLAAKAASRRSASSAVS